MSLANQLFNSILITVQTLTIGYPELLGNINLYPVCHSCQQEGELKTNVFCSGYFKWTFFFPKTQSINFHSIFKRSIIPQIPGLLWKLSTADYLCVHESRLNLFAFAGAVCWAWSSSSKASKLHLAPHMDESFPLLDVQAGHRQVSDTVETIHEGFCTCWCHLMTHKPDGSTPACKSLLCVCKHLLRVVAQALGKV